MCFKTLIWAMIKPRDWIWAPLQAQVSDSLNRFEYEKCGREVAYLRWSISSPLYCLKSIGIFYLSLWKIWKNNWMLMSLSESRGSKSLPVFEKKSNNTCEAIHSYWMISNIYRIVHMIGFQNFHPAHQPYSCKNNIWKKSMTNEYTNLWQKMG